MKRDAEARECRPLRHRLELVHRFRRLDLDNSQKATTLFGRLQDEVRKPWRRTAHRRGLLVAGVDGDFELSLVFRLKEANDAVVLELLADGPHEDRAQHNLRREYIGGRSPTPSQECE